MMPPEEVVVVPEVRVHVVDLGRGPVRQRREQERKKSSFEGAACLEC